MAVLFKFFREWHVYVTINIEIALSDKMIWRVQNYQRHAVDKIMDFIPKGIFLANFVHDKPKNIFASERPNWEPITTPSICLYKVLSNL